jgi:hypothetical protein
VAYRGAKEGEGDGKVSSRESAGPGSEGEEAAEEVEVTTHEFIGGPCDGEIMAMPESPYVVRLRNVPLSRFSLSRKGVVAREDVILRGCYGYRLRQGKYHFAGAASE